GTRAMSGSEAISLTKRSIAALPSSMPSSMLTSMICAPASTCWRATATAAAKSPALIRSRNFAEPVTLVRSPTLTNSDPGPMLRGSRPERRSISLGASACGQRARLLRTHMLGDVRDVIRSGATAAADDIDQPRTGELFENAGRFVRLLVVLAEG